MDRPDGKNRAGVAPEGSPASLLYVVQRASIRSAAGGALALKGGLPTSSTERTVVSKAWTEYGLGRKALTPGGSACPVSAPAPRPLITIIRTSGLSRCRARMVAFPS